MEQKHLLGWSTLGLGLSMGVGLGLGLATRGLVKPTCLSPRPSEILETELYAQVIDGKDSSVTFDQFPYYLKISWLVRSEQTRVLLTNAAYVHLMQREYSKFTRNLSPASPAILLTGPAGSEAYQQMLAKALAHYFEAKLLLLDVSDFLSKVQCKCGELKLGLEPASGMFTKVVADKINDFYVSLSDLAIQIPENVRRSFSSGSVTPYPEKTKANLKTSGSKKALDGKSSPKIQEAEAGGGKGIASFRNGLYQGSSPRRTSPRGFDDKSLIDALFRVLASVSQNSPIVLYLRDVQKLLFRGQKTYSLFVRKMKFSGPVLILGSRISHGTDIEESDIVVEKLEKIFPYTISIKAPEDIARLVSWRSQLEEDMKAIEAQDNRNHISEVLAANDVECDDLASICFNDTLLLSNYIEEIAVSAISHHLMNTEEPNYRAGSLLISSKSLAYGLSLFQAGQLETKDSKLQAEVKSEPTKEPQETSAKSMVKAEVPIVDAKSESSKPDSGLEVTKKAETDGSKGIPAAAGAKVAVCLLTFSHSP